MAKEKVSEINKEYSTEYLKYTFSDGEKSEIASEMARKVGDLAAAEDEKKAVMSDLKSQIDVVSAGIRSAAAKLNNGYEYRNIKCEIVRNFVGKQIEYYRVDTGELAKSKRMTDDDLQRKITD